MSNKLNLYVHGENDTKITFVNNGKTRLSAPIKFCVEHDWIDLIFIGGDLEWQRKHGKCQPPATLKPQLKKAA